MFPRNKSTPSDSEQASLPQVSLYPSSSLPPCSLFFVWIWHAASDSLKSMNEGGAAFEYGINHGHGQARERGRGGAQAWSVDITSG